MDSKLNLNILPDEQKILFDVLKQQTWLNSYYLVGGTALALYIGHRQSVDFDFFSECDFDNTTIIGTLSQIGNFELFSQSENTVDGSLNDVKVSFITYKYPLLKPSLKYENILIADMLDIALMKLEAIAGRGSMKDFIDLFFLLKYYSLSELFEMHKEKYGAAISNQYHLLKSLVYFDDAERDIMPKMLINVNWNVIKNTIVGEVKNLKQ